MTPIAKLLPIATRESARTFGDMSRYGGPSAAVVLRWVQPTADLGVELELQRRTLRRLAVLPRPPTLGPMRPNFVRPARSIGDAAVKRLDRQSGLRALADQRVEAPAEPIHLDNVARPDSVESHGSQAYARARRFPAALAKRV